MREEGPLRWGLLSTARINRALIPALRRSKGSRLAAVASRDAEKGRKYAREWDIPTVHGSYEDLLADPEIDVVYVSLPNSMHAMWTIRAAEAGKHVLCEKPLALSEEEVDAIEKAARQAGVVVAEAFMYRHHPQTLKVKALVQGGTLGQLRLVRGCFTFRIGREEDIRLNAELGGGSIWDIGCYPISYARYLAGAEPLEVFGWQATGPGGVDETFAGQLRFPGDVFAQFDSSFRLPSRAQVEVVGSEASLLIPEPYKPSEADVIYLQRGNEVETLDMPGEMLYLGEVEDLENAVQTGAAPRVSLADSRGNVNAIRSLLESARLGKPVRLG